MDQTLPKYFIPGPTWVRPEVMERMTGPMIGHRSADFRAIAANVFRDLKELFDTSQHAFVATSSGTGLLEGALLNCVPRSVLVTTCGAFSERWLKIAQQLGVEADPLEHPWGTPLDPVRLENHLKGRRHHYDAVTITHNETSTGVLNDLATLARVVRESSSDTLVLVDAVSSLGSTPIHFDGWGLDVCLASTQKGLALPPGVTVFAVSDRALAKAAKEKFRGTYFDFMEFRRQAETNSVPFTPSVPHFYALEFQLDEILRKETLPKRWERHAAMRELTIERSSRWGDLLPPREVASPSVSTIRPRSLAAPELVARLRERGFVVSSGYGQLREETLRIGHMGDIPIEAVAALLDAIDEEVER